jgi:hypothetical protein
MNGRLTAAERFFIRVLRVLMQPGRLVTAVLKRWNVGSHELRLALDAYPRPHYAYGVHQAAVLARHLGVKQISVLEFGVAGGRGLAELQRMADLATEATGVEIDIYGFDSSVGLPKPTDYRDLPYTWRTGDFTMDVAALQARVPNAHLILGEIDETIQDFLAERTPAPIGFVSVDVDYYSSTVSALKLFQGRDEFFLPRVFCYFDDTVGDLDQTIHNDFVGELAAIREFNEDNERMKLGQINGLASKRVIPADWNELMYALHRFDHPDYATYIGDEDTETELPLR